MAKKDKIDFDDFDFDEFGSADPFGDGVDPKDNRSPTVKVSTGFMRGVKETATSGSFMRKLVLGSLPKGYDTAADTIDSVVSEGAGLYNEISNEARPIAKELKRTVKRVSGMLDPVLPESWSKKIKELLSEKEETNIEQQVIDANEAAISQALGGIFEQQKEADQQRRATDLIKDAVDSKRHESEFAQLDAIRRSTQSLATYQNTVTIQYQRKLLETTYRNYFANRDTLEVTKAYSQESVSLLRAILKNTGLPEAQKIENSELASQLLKERLFGKLQDVAGGYTRQFIQDVFANAKLAARGKLDEFRSAVSAAHDASESAETIAELAEMSGTDGYTMTGELAGGTFAQTAGNWVGKKLRKFTSKNDKLVSGANRAINISENLPGYIRQWARSDTDYSKPFASTIDGFKSLIPGMRGQQPIGFNTLANSANPANFDNQTHLTINEIIPGYLARILQSSEGIRTGQDNTPLTTYDKTSNAFMSQRQLGQKVYKQAIDKYTMQSIDDRTGDLINKIDAKGKLDPATRRALQQELLKRSQTEDMFDPKLYSQEDRFSPDISHSQATAIAEAVKEAFGIGDDGKMSGSSDVTKRHTDVNRAFRDVRRAYPQLEELANLQANTGNRDVLRQMGLLQQRNGRDYINDNFIREKFKEYQTQGSDYEASMLASFPEDQGQVPTRPYQMSAGNTPRKSIMQRINDYISRSEAEPVTGPAAVASGKPVESPFSENAVLSITDAIKEQSSRKASESAVERLDKIVELITQLQEKGIPGMMGPPEPGMMDKGASLAKRGFKAAGGMFGSLFRAGKWAGDTLMGGAKSAFGFGTGMLGGLVDKLRGGLIQDVYAAGKIRLTGEGIRAGEYFDALTGDVITSIKDIKGAVKDKSGQIVMTYDQYKEGLFGANGRKILTGLAEKLGDTAGGILGWGVDQFGKGLKLPGKLMNFASQTAKEFLNPPKDIYVPGEKLPRLTAIGMKLGEYFNSSDYKPIRNVSDIKSDVMDSHGAIRLTMDEFTAGVVDQHGKPIRSIGQSLGGLLRTGFDMAVKANNWMWKQAGKGVKLVKDIATGGMNAAGRMFGMSGSGGFGMGSGSHDQTQLQVESLNVLKMIYNLLKNQFGGEGEDLPMTESPTGGSGGPGFFGNMKSKIAGYGKSAKDWFNKKRGKYGDEFVGPNMPLGERLNRTKDDVAEQASEIVAAIKAKIADIGSGDPSKDEILNDGKDTILSRFKTKANNARISIRDMIKEKNTTERKGSWMERFANRNKGKDDKEFVGPMQPSSDDGSKGIFGKILGAIMGLGGVLGGIWSTAKGFLTGLGSLKDVIKAYMTGSAVGDVLGGGDVPDGPDRKGKKGKKPGKLRRMGRGLGRGLGALGRGAWAVTKAAGWVARGAWVLGSGVIGALSAPVVLTAAAVAAVGYGAYKAYRWYKDRLLPLQKVRMAQYGIDTENKDHYLKVGEFEMGLKDHLKTNSSGVMELDKSVDYRKWMEHFGVNSDSADQQMQWSQWFMRRFKPVFLSNVTLLNKMAPGIALEAADEMENSIKVPFVKATKFADGNNSPYSVYESPFPGYKNTTGLAAIDAAIAEVEKEFGKDANAKVMEVGKTSITPKAEARSVVPMGRDSVSLHGNVGSGIDYMSQSQANTKKSTFNMVASGGMTLPSNIGNDRVLDDLAAVRMGTYGLLGLDIGRVNLLLSLENEVLRSVSYQGKQAAYDGDPGDLYAKYSSRFGGNTQEDLNRWQYWFKMRFLPTVLQFASSVRRADSSVAPSNAFKALTPAQRFDVAQDVVATLTEAAIRPISVWMIDVSPFTDLPANVDKGSVKPYLDSLQMAINNAEYVTAPKYRLGKVEVSSKAESFQQFKKRAPLPTPTAQDLAPAAYRPSFTKVDEAAAGKGGLLYKDLPNVRGNGKYEAFSELLMSVANTVGIDPMLLAGIVRTSSGYDAAAKDGESSRAGLFQFEASTWRDLLDKYGKKYDIPLNTKATDPRAAMLLGAEYLRENKEKLEGKLGRKATNTDMYVAHVLGAQDGLKFLSSENTADVSKLFPKAARENKSLFFNESGKGRTVAELYKAMESRITDNLTKAQVNASDPSVIIRTIANSNDNIVNEAKVNLGDLPKPVSNAAQKASPNAPTGTPPKRQVAEPAEARVNDRVNDAVSPISSNARSQREIVEQRRQDAAAQAAKERFNSQMTNMETYLAASLKTQTLSTDYLKQLVELAEARAGAGGSVARTAPKPKVNEDPPSSLVSVNRTYANT